GGAGREGGGGGRARGGKHVRGGGGGAGRAAPLPAGLGLDDGGGGAGGLADGGREEVDAFCPRRASRSRTRASSSATRRSRAAMRASRSRQPGQSGSVMPSELEGAQLRTGFRQLTRRTVTPLFPEGRMALIAVTRLRVRSIRILLPFPC